MKFMKFMKPALILAAFIFTVVLALIFLQLIGLHAFHSAACKQRGAAYAARVKKLEQDAHDHLKIGTKKEGLVRFFQDNGIPVTFLEGEASGTIYTTGCAPLGCGSDDALLGLRVKIDKDGMVIGEPDVGAIYTNCL